MADDLLEDGTGEATGARGDGAARPEAVPERNRFPSRVVGPVVQFSLLIVPVVMSTFFLVYALMGLILDGRDLLNWSIEAAPNAPWVCAAIALYSILVAAFALARGAGYGHPLVVSGAVHTGVALACTGLILATVQRV